MLPLSVADHHSAAPSTGEREDVDLERLRDRVAIITGGGGAIGGATARRLASEGAIVVLVGRRMQPMRRVVDEIRAANGRAVARSCDVTREAGVRRLFSYVVRSFGHVDILVNNAGVQIPGSVINASLADWQRTFAVNATGAFLCSKLAVPIMIAHDGGSIIHMSSTAGLVGESDNAAYCASKGALLMLARQMAVDYSSAGIRVNAVCPGWIDTEFNLSATESLGGPDAVQALIERTVPIQRRGSPEEVADVVAFLASDDSRLVTGAVLVVDGGFTAA